MMSTTVQESKTRPEPSARSVEYLVPAVSILETKDAYVLEAEMPGVNKQGLKVTIEGTELMLVGHRHEAQPEGEPLLRERRIADYRRVFELDPAIDPNGIKAEIQQGELTLTLPKSERVKPRRIAVAD